MEIPKDSPQKKSFSGKGVHTLYSAFDNFAKKLIKRVITMKNLSTRTYKEWFRKKGFEVPL